MPDIVSFRVDFADWLGSLLRRKRRIAASLAVGNRTSEVAQKFTVSEGRVSQLRRDLAASWRQFVAAQPAKAPRPQPPVPSIYLWQQRQRR